LGHAPQALRSGELILDFISSGSTKQVKHRDEGKTYMKKIDWALLLGLGFCIFCFIGLAPALEFSARNIEGISPVAVQKLSLESIKEKIKNEGRNVLQAIEYKNIYVLIESIGSIPEGASYFELFNLETGTRAGLPTGSSHVRLKKIVDENMFVFFADGTNSVNSQVFFPFLIKCCRDDEQGAFSASQEPAYLAVGQEASFGDCEGEQLAELKLTTEGLEAIFDPVINHGAYEDIPPTRTSLVKDKGLFLISFRQASLSPRLKKGGKNLTLQNSYFSSIEIKEGPDSVTLTLHLTEKAKSYSGQILTMKTGKLFPYLALSFSEETGQGQ
jgi:hypothetical protein